MKVSVFGVFISMKSIAFAVAGGMFTFTCFCCGFPVIGLRYPVGSTGPFPKPPSSNYTGFYSEGNFWEAVWNGIRTWFGDQVKGLPGYSTIKPIIDGIGAAWQQLNDAAGPYLQNPFVVAGLILGGLVLAAFALESLFLAARWALVGVGRGIAGAGRGLGRGLRNLWKSEAGSVPRMGLWKDTLGKKPQAANSRLQGAFDQLFKPTDEAPGGTAGAIREQLETGKLVGNRDHITKGVERIRQLERILKEENLSPADKSEAQEVINDLLDALKPTNSIKP